MSLDPSTAAELLKAASPQAVTRLVAEMACLQAGPDAKAQAAEGAREFCGLIADKSSRSADRFLKETLEKALGKEKSREMLHRLEDLVRQQDPFAEIRSIPAGDLLRALEGESPQVAAMVLGELTPKRSAEVLAALDPKLQIDTVRVMTSGQEAGVEIRRRVADLVMGRLKSPTARQQARQEQQLRKVARLLRTLGGELRGDIVKAVQESDPAAAKNLQEAMVTWDDIVQITDRSLQEALRSSDSRRLALALVGAEANLLAKVRSCMSERAAAMLEEEASLLSSPRPEEIQKAREAILSDLRELNANNMLNFVDA
jgi:flagellar motor switch protein FliG